MYMYMYMYIYNYRNNVNRQIHIYGIQRIIKTRNNISNIVKGIAPTYIVTNNSQIILK